MMIYPERGKRQVMARANYGADLQEYDCADSSSRYELLHMLSELVEPGTTARKLTIEILLPSGISPGTFFVPVTEGGGILNVVVPWPNSSVDRKHLH